MSSDFWSPKRFDISFISLIFIFKIFSLSGDVVTPGFFDEYLNAENILHMPYGAGENMVFNFAYNLMTLKFKKASKQLSDQTLQVSLKYLNIGKFDVSIFVLRWRCSWCNGYRRRKWTRRLEFKSRTRMIAFPIALIPLGKVWIQLFSLQLWVNSRTDWVLQPWWGN